MKTTDYLSQARFLDMRIGSKLQQIESLNELATSCSAVINGMPHNPNKGASRMADAVCKIISLEEEINQDVDALVDLKAEITRYIKSVSDTELQTILEKRYLCFLSWKKVATDMSYSMQHTFRMHDKAIKEITPILKHESKVD